MRNLKNNRFKIKFSTIEQDLENMFYKEIKQI